jgi:hypothetical protein
VAHLAITFASALVLIALSGPALADDVAVDASRRETAQQVMREPSEQGVSLQIDNDLFSGMNSDRGYTGGAGFVFGTPRHDPIVTPVEAIREYFDRMMPGSVPEEMLSLRSTQIALIEMTPGDLSISAPQPNDRPYASLLSLTTSQLKIREDGRSASYSSFGVGVLGLPVMGSIQKGFHSVFGGLRPRGWNHQISEGGEPTFRFVRAEQWLLGAREAATGGVREGKLTLSGSVGYLTEASIAVSLRAGRIRSAWWNFNPELADYIEAPIAPAETARTNGSELYGFIGARLKARAYNALLQGQFRSSDVRVSGGRLERIQAEAWAGFASDLGPWRLSYALRVSSKEVSAGAAARTLVWGGISIERAF